MDLGFNGTLVIVIIVGILFIFQVKIKLEFAKLYFRMLPNPDHRLKWIDEPLERYILDRSAFILSMEILEIAIKAGEARTPACYDLLPKALHSIAFDVVWEYRNPDRIYHALSDIRPIYDQVRQIITREIIDEFEALNKAPE